MKKTWVTSFAASLVLGASLMATPVQAAFPGQNGLIAFEASSDFQSDIYLVNSDGSFATNITRSPEHVEVTPAFSADGARIAFQRSNMDYSGADIWTMAIDGSGQVQVTATPKFDESYPAFSPDGTMVAFLSYDNQTFEGDLRVSGVDGTGARNLTNGGDIVYGHVSWSPDGSKIVYSKNAPTSGGQGGIFAVDVVSGVSTRLTSTTDYEFDPDYSPDGTQIVYTHSPNQGTQEHRLMNADGSNVSVLFKDDENSFTYGAVWAPDGSGVLVGANENYRPVIGFIDIATRAFTELMSQEGYVTAWQPCPSSCPALSSPSGSVVGVNAFNSRRATLASVKVTPLHVGAPVEVTYLRKTSGAFKKVTTKQATIGDTGFANVRLKLFKSGRCKIVGSFAGDEDHTASSGKVLSRCNAFSSGGG